MLKHAVHFIISLALKLDDVIFLQLRHIPIRQRLGPKLRLFGQEILHLIILLKLVLGDQKVEIDERDGDHFLALGGKPSDFLLGFLHVALKVELEFEGRDGFHVERVHGVRDGAHVRVTPVHEGDFLVLDEGLGVGLLDEDGFAVGDFFGAQVRVLAVFRFVFGIWGQSCTPHFCSDSILFVNGGVAWSDGVDVFLVRGPEDGPVEVDDVAAGTLLQDELAEGGNGHTAASDATYSWETWVIPAPNQTLVDKLSELPGFSVNSLDNIATT